MDEWDWEEARRRCLALALGLLRSREDAEDAVQEALMRGWRHEAACRNRQAPIPWLMTITRRECLRLARRRGEREEVGLEDMRELAWRPDDFEGTEAVVDLHAAVTVLSERERELVELRYVRQLTQEEIARLTGLPEGTVKTRLHRLRGRLRSRMEVA